jgi:hypothetical protein
MVGRIKDSYYFLIKAGKWDLVTSSMGI